MTIDLEQRKRIVTVDARESGDAALVEKALLGGPDGFRPVVEKFQSAVFAVALSRIRDFHLAEDIAQQVFIEAYQKLDTLKEPEKLGGWLRTITVRKAVNAIRGGRNEVPIEQDGSDGLLVGDANVDFERQDLRRRVGKAIASLRET
jgi:RNA polymerase sigma-70 factor (ECF subfamily)